MKENLNEFENQVFTETALWAQALNINEKDKLVLMTEMIKTKPVDVYAYQALVIAFFLRMLPQKIRG